MGQISTDAGYKAAEAGIWAIEVNSKNTSQVCSNCGKFVQKTLAQKIHKCFQCGLKIDRDINAARNILKLALNIVGTTGINPFGKLRIDPERSRKVNACGVEGLLSTTKQEATVFKRW